MHSDCFPHQAGVGTRCGQPEQVDSHDEAPMWDKEPSHITECRQQRQFEVVDKGLSMGRGFPCRSSTASELVAVVNCMPAICWTRYFLTDQGYSVSDTIVFKDNKSAILLEKNGKSSSTKNQPHTHPLFLFHLPHQHWRQAD